MIPFLLPLMFATDLLPVLAGVSLDAARRLDGRPVVAWVDVDTPPYTFAGRTVAAPSEQTDGVNRAAYLFGEVDIPWGGRVKVSGTLRVVRHAGHVVNGVRVRGWTEIRIEGGRVVP